MSTEWCVKCVTCDVLCDSEWVYPSKKTLLVAYVKLWEHIKVIEQSASDLTIADCNTGKLVYMDQFMFEHAEHTLVMHDEYGRDFPLEESSA